MIEFRIFETLQFQADIERIAAGRREKLIAKLRGFVYPQLRAQPHFGKNIKKLKDFKSDTWRYRIGPYRFFYIIGAGDRIVFMVSADTRQGSYR